MNYPGDLTVEELACVHVALQNQITERRQYLEAIAGPPHTFRTKIAERTAYWLRAAEHAYHKLGGTNPNYLPAVYRPPSPGRPAHNQNTTTSGTPSPPEAFAAPPPQVSPAGPDPTLGTPNPRQPSPTRAATPPPLPASAPNPMDCCGGYPGEHLTDTCPLIARVTDRQGDRYLTPLGDTRQRAVPCTVCREPTFALDTLCDRHATERAERAVTHLDPQARKALL